MRTVIKINHKSGLVYIPERFRESGFVGDVECLTNEVVLILMRPGIPLEDIRDNLKAAIVGMNTMIRYNKQGNVQIVDLAFGTKDKSNDN